MITIDDRNVYSGIYVDNKYLVGRLNIDDNAILKYPLPTSDTWTDAEGASAPMYSDFLGHSGVVEGKLTPTMPGATRPWASSSNIGVTFNSDTYCNGGWFGIYRSISWTNPDDILQSGAVTGTIWDKRVMSADESCTLLFHNECSASYGKIPTPQNPQPTPVWSLITDLKNANGGLPYNFTYDYSDCPWMVSLTTKFNGKANTVTITLNKWVKSTYTQLLTTTIDYSRNGDNSDYILYNFKTFRENSVYKGYLYVCKYTYQNQLTKIYEDTFTIYDTTDSTLKYKFKPGLVGTFHSVSSNTLYLNVVPYCSPHRLMYGAKYISSTGGGGGVIA